MTRVLGASHQVAGYLVTRATSYEVWREDGRDRISALEVVADSGAGSVPSCGIPCRGATRRLGRLPRASAGMSRLGPRFLRIREPLEHRLLSTAN